MTFVYIHLTWMYTDECHPSRILIILTTLLLKEHSWLIDCHYMQQASMSSRIAWITVWWNTGVMTVWWNAQEFNEVRCASSFAIFISASSECCHDFAEFLLEGRGRHQFFSQSICPKTESCWKSTRLQLDRYAAELSIVHSTVWYLRSLWSSSKAKKISTRIWGGISPVCNTVSGIQTTEFRKWHDTDHSSTAFAGSLSDKTHWVMFPTYDMTTDQLGHNYQVRCQAQLANYGMWWRVCL